MKKRQRQLKRAICMILVLCMVTGSLSGCTFGENAVNEDVQDTATEVEEIVLSSKNQDAILLLAGEKPELQLDTTAGEVVDIALTPEDQVLEPYKYYTVKLTIAAKENESFAKSLTVILDGVELAVKDWSKDKLTIEYTALALPETITTEEMSKVSSYNNVKNAKIIGKAKVQALLDYELNIFSEDGEDSYVVEKGFVPLFMIPSFVANGPLEAIKDGTTVQIISEHGEKDFAGAQGQWYKIAVDGKVGYVPASFLKNVKITEKDEAAQQTQKPSASVDKEEEPVQTKPAMNPTIYAYLQPGETVNKENSDHSSNNNSTTNDKDNSGNDSDSDSDSGIQEITYYEVAFALGGGISSEDAFLPDAIRVKNNSTINLNQLAIPSVPGYLFDGWFYDSALTKQVQNGDAINKNMTLYAKLKELTGEDVVVGEDNYVSSINEDASSFTITVLKPAVMRSTEAAADIAKLRNLADPEATMEVLVLEDTTIDVDNVSYVKYLISSDELEGGETYQLELLNDNYVFYYGDEVQAAQVRFYNFTTKMGGGDNEDDVKVENLSLNNDLIYLKFEDVQYTEGSDDVSGLFTATVEDDITQLNTVEGKGSFIYTGDETLGVGTTVVIYDGDVAPKLGEGGLDPAEQYDGKAAYLTISKAEGDTFYYGVAEAEDVLFTPDVFPINTADDEDNDTATLTIDTEKLHFSGSDYAEMGLDEDTTVDVGDYLAFYSGSMETAEELIYGKITAISVSGEDTILTYDGVTEDVVLESMAVYSKDALEFEIDEDTAEAIEAEMEQDAINSGFAMEAANYLAAVALATDEMQNLKNEMGIESLTYTLEDGSVVDPSTLQLSARSNVAVKNLSVKAAVNRKLEKLGNIGIDNKNGVRAQLQVGFTIVIGSGENQLKLNVAAIFEQEVLLDYDIKGKTIWGKKWIFPYIKDYRVTTNLDVGTYTGIAITATVETQSGPEYDWNASGKALSEQIRDLMNQKDSLFGQDINAIEGGLAGKYAALMKNNAEWVDLVEVKIFSAEAKILAGIIVVGVQADFVVSANINIMLGMTFDYKTAKRYNFTLYVLSKTSNSDSIDLVKSEYNFDMYVMGSLGVRAGVRLTVYAGLFSKKVAAIGITAEAGAYLQLWGYFFYSNHWVEGSDKVTSVSGAMLMEVGAYLEIRFLATAIGGIFEYNPILYDKYWPLWNMGSVDNVYDFNYKTTVGAADDKDINMGAAASVALPTDRMNMSYMNLKDGKINNKTFTYKDFTITTTGNFTYENGVIKVNPQEGSAEEKGTIKLTWNGAELSFTSQPLSCEMDITWKDPSRIHNVSYDLHGGKAMENGNVLPEGIPNTEAVVGGKLTAPTVEIAKDYYTFDGWYKDAAYTEAWNFDTDKVVGNTVLHAKWKPISYDIAYELNGGNNHSSNPATYTVETAVNLEAPTRAGYAFAGWNTAADGSGSVVTEIPVGSYGAKTLYALWTALEQTYEIHHMLQGLDGVTYELIETVTATAKTGETVTIGVEQSKAYTDFTYDANLTTESSGIIPGEGTLCLKLYYSRNNYNVTFVAGNGTDPVVVSTIYQGKVTEPEKPTREGYDFTGWYVITDSSRLWDFANDIVTEETELRAGWEAKEYNVVFDLQAGSGGDSNVKAYYDRTLESIAVPARNGYQFLGYFDADGKQYYNADGSGAVAWDKAELPEGVEYFTLYAKWQANNYEVIFDANGGTGTMNKQSFVYDAEQALQANSFTRTGYTFAGWATAANAETAEYADVAAVKNLTVGEAATLYAVWTPVTYSVIFDGNGADGGSMEAQGIFYDKETGLNANAYTKTGYHFVGWATAANAEVVYADAASVKNLSTGDTVTLYAVWEANTYNVAFYANGGEGTMENQALTYDDAAKALNTNAYSRIGYRFAGWATDSTATNAEYTDGQKVQNLISEHKETLTLYAVWQANSYTVKFDGNGAGSGSMEAQTFSYDEEKALTKNGFVRGGYTFMGWATDSQAASWVYTDGQMVENLLSEHQGEMTLYAAWQVNQYTVHFDSNQGSGSTIPTTAGDIQVTYDSTYGSLPEVTREGYTFNGWFTAASGGTQVKFTDKVAITEAQTLYAQWTPNTYTVTYGAEDGQFADGTTDKQIQQNFDSKYTLPENPTREGYTFIGWFIDGTEVTSATDMTKVQNHTLYAQWQAIVVNNISVSVGGVTLSYSGSPVYAKTDSDGNVTAGGNEEDYNIKLENGVLTLKNAVITYAPVSNYHNGALSATGDLTITLAEGTENIITNTSANSGISAWNCGVYVDGNLTINGKGSLIANGGKGQSSHGISVDSGDFASGKGDLIIDGAVVKAYGGNAGGSSGIYTYLNLEIKNGATVDAVGGNVSSGSSYGIESRVSITITNSSGRAQGDTHAMSKSATITEATSVGSYTAKSMTWTKVTE